MKSPDEVRTRLRALSADALLDEYQSKGRTEALRKAEPNPLHEFVEDYIRGLPWSEEPADYEKTLVAGNIRTFAHAFRAALTVPSEGIASVAASDAIAELEAAVIHHEMNKKAGLGIVSAQRLNDARVALRAALAASDESLSRQSSEAAESLRSTRNTQGNL